MSDFGKMVSSTAIVAVLAIALVANAHHSRSEFSKERVEMTGELVRVMWRNPHAGLSVVVQNDSGDSEQWRIETYGSPNLFGRMGVEREFFVTGEQITVSGFPSTRRDNYMLVTNVLLESGMEALLTATHGPLWSDNYVGGAEYSDRDLSKTAEAAAENRGLFRNWSIAGRTIGVHRHFPYPEETRAAMAAWDPVTAPVNRCETPGMPMPMYQPLSMEFIDNGDTITVNVEYFGIERTVHMNDSVDPESIDSSPLGYSVGHWEGDTLVVDTTRIDYPWFNSGGAPQSEDVRVVERFAVSEDQAQMDFSMKIYDDVTFTEPASTGRLYVALGEPFVPLDCTVF